MKKILRNGFTVIELLVVIAIIAVLAAVSLFGLAGSRESARDARRKADLETLRTGLELYRSDCKYYPPSVTAGAALAGDGSSTACSSSNKYIQKVPADPANPNRTYRYTRLTNFTYEICAALETGTGSISCSSSCSTISGVNCNYKVNNP